MIRARAIRAAGLAAIGALAALGCATAPPAPAGPFVSGGFNALQLIPERVAVLPLTEIALPPGAAARDSLAQALIGIVDGGLAPALVQTGVTGRAVGPGDLADVLVALGPPALARACAAAAAAGPGGRVEGAGRDDLRALGEAVDARYLLLPRTLAIHSLGGLAHEAALTVDLVDAGSGTVVWRETVRAAPETPPAGDAASLAAAAMADATRAVLQRTALRLTRLGRDADGK